MNEEIMVADIHMHAVPDIDDGSVSVEMSLEMLRSAYDQGARIVFMTSHSGAVAENPSKYFDAFDILQNECVKTMPDLQLFEGCEVFILPDIMDEVMQLLEAGELPTLAGTEYVLAEIFDYMEGTERINRIKWCLSKLLNAGYIPVLAHVERYSDLLGSIEIVKELKAMGCLVQINLYSIAEESDPVRSKWADTMLQLKLVDFVGTDAHRTNHRPPMIRRGTQAILENCDRDYAEAILHGNAEKLILGYE